MIPAPAPETDEDFQKRVVNTCTDEVFKVRKPEKIKKVTTIMKKYEDLIYERFIKRTPVATLDKRNEKEEFQNAMNAGVKFPFVGDASFLTNYNRLLRGYIDESSFKPKEMPYEVNVKMPSEMKIKPPPNQFIAENKNYVDTQANSKYYFPQDHEPRYNNMSIYNNKPIGDISNTQNHFVTQLNKAGMLDPYSQQNYGSPTLPPRDQPNLASSQFTRQSTTPYQNDFGRQTNALSSPPFGSQMNTQMNPMMSSQYNTQMNPQMGQMGQMNPQYNQQMNPPFNPQMSQMNPQMGQMNPQMGQMNPQMGQMGPMNPQMNQMNHQFSEEDYKLRRNIELLGGIEKTIPNMERSLRDNELKNIEPNFKYQNYPENTSNSRLNNLMHNPIRDMYSPQFDAPNARSNSPIRGGYPEANRPNLYYSPAKSNYGQEVDYRQNDMRQNDFRQNDFRQNDFRQNDFRQNDFGQNDIRQNDMRQNDMRQIDMRQNDMRQNDMRQIDIRQNEPRQNNFREALSEKNVNTPKKLNFSSSKSLRNEKADVLNVRYEIPANYGQHVEGQE